MDGVVFRDRVNQQQLAEEFLSSQCFLYPTSFTETSCITAMEAQAANCHIITSPVAALKETCANYPFTVFIEGDSFSKEYQDKFVAATVKALNTPLDIIPHDQRFSLTTLAQDWDKLFSDIETQNLIFPLVSYVPTAKYRNPRKVTNNSVKLNIACGTSIFPHDGWQNTDHADFNQYFQFIKDVPHSQGMPDHQRKLWEYVHLQGGEIHYVKHDMTTPFTVFPDNVFDFIYIGQALEHVHYFTQAPKLVAECFRMLRPGGIIRITTPDLAKLLTAYHTDNMEIFNAEQPAFYRSLPRQAQLPLILFGASGDKCTQSHYEGHFFIYTEKTMTMLLEQAGFKEVEYTYPKRGKNKAIAEEIEDFGFSHSLIAEAIK